MSATLLDRILEDKRRRLRGPSTSAAGDGPPSDGDGFVRALRSAGVRVIAEIKARSPSAGEILASPAVRVEAIARAFAAGGAAAISVVTEQDHFGGDPAWVPRARAASGLPVLMKDFFVDEAQLDEAAGLGADAVLLIVGALEGEALGRMREAARGRGLAVIVEAHGEEEVRRAAAVEPEVLGVNARDLRTFTVNHAAMPALAAAVPEGIVRLAESGIAGREDIARLRAAGYDAFLVGESLLRAGDPESALRGLMS